MKYRFFLFVFIYLLLLSHKALASVLINEILPDPAGKDSQGEWIELYNNSNKNADLSNWKVRDLIGQNRTYIFPDRTEIKPFDFLLCPILKTKISLNNSGDAVELLDANSVVRDKVEYSTAKPGLSYSKTDKGWVWSETPTPEKTNVIKQTEPKAKILTSASSPISAPKEQSAKATFCLAVGVALTTAMLVLYIKKKKS